jgi:hypothetical protein
MAVLRKKRGHLHFSRVPVLTHPAHSALGSKMGR